MAINSPLYKSCQLEALILSDLSGASLTLEAVKIRI